jgi:hypothetical protein
MIFDFFFKSIDLIYRFDILLFEVLENMSLYLVIFKVLSSFLEELLSISFLPPSFSNSLVAVDFLFGDGFKHCLPLQAVEL